ncbi:hypothetical protein [Clostridium folliculivorans]|uniref:Uncharacterized protein n=1 Tax=Clostridium folliculivorans TaxID=2886038 RepID=A0A9W5Y5J6_9CLOT|nr:hypothetical protein [Clostridium folliculivorans]GKU27129.1 hypothetical protein CFOLD11_39560 [Clostridium folliculivorans]GKU31746.1 hypothetical protein CFB3_38530 [Clostridium folliculivorans]
MKFSYADEYFFPVVMKNIELFDFVDNETEEELLRRKKDENLYNELFKTVDDEFIDELLRSNI